MSWGRLIVWALAVLVWTSTPAWAEGMRKPACAQGKSKAKKKRRRKKRRRNPKRPKAAAKAGDAALPTVSPSEAAALFADAPPEAGASSSTPQARADSKVTPGTASRWSNRGALEPVESPVELTAPLPERNQPRPVGVETPGQARKSSADLLSARIAFSGYRVSTAGQDVLYEDEKDANGNLVRRPGDRDIELLRARATLGYERIAGSDVSVRVDVELRPRLNGEGRFDNQRLNEAYVAWGLTDVSRRGGPDFGIALGRVAVREAGQAQADGLAVRWRPTPGLQVGAFGGVTGNPYGYNWALRAAETFSTDWVTGGAFVRWRGRQLQASLAGVYTASTVPRAPPDPGNSDRIYVQADAGWQPTRTLDIFATGTFDLLPNGQLVQNAEIVAAWTPNRFNLALGVGRFSTVVYEVSTGYSFTVDPAGNTYGEGPDNLPIVDEQGRAVVPFDAALLTAIYNQVRLSAGYRLIDELELFVRTNALIRDVSVAQDQVANLTGAVPLAPTVNFSALRLLPAVGARYRDPNLLDADAQLTLIVDDQSQADAVVRLGVGRDLFGLYLRADGRYVVGTIPALDGGLTATYALPRSWLPGRLQLRAAFRYFREEVALARPAADDQTGALEGDVVRDVLPVQESLLGFAGIEWRL